VSRFRTIFSRNPNRFVIDESLPISSLWEYAEGKTINTSAFGLSTLPQALMPAAAIFMVIIFYTCQCKVIAQAAIRSPGILS
jgi:hypothetical protein